MIEEKQGPQYTEQHPILREYCDPKPTFNSKPLPGFDNNPLTFYPMIWENSERSLNSKSPLTRFLLRTKS